MKLPLGEIYKKCRSYNDQPGVNSYLLHPQKGSCYDGLLLPIQVVQIGNGRRTLLATYGCHGNEIASAQSFLHSIRNILKQNLAQNVTYIGVLLNPEGVMHGHRSLNPFDKKNDMNRDWQTLAFSYTRCGRQFIDRVLKKNHPDSFLHLDHHEDRTNKSYFLSGRNENIGQQITDRMKRLGKNVFNTKADESLETLCQHIEECGFNSLCFETGRVVDIGGFFSSLLPMPAKKLSERINLHVLADEIALRILAEKMY
ncbi:hypothetical protein BVX95_01550 [archaeon D22]|nr:hypothetical protein BVX95_01550 [archaeon D22]